MKKHRLPWNAVTVAVAGLLVLATSFLPWYHVRWLASDDGIDSWHTNVATAWTASTRWTTAVLLALTAAVLWPVVRSHATRWICPALAAAAVALVHWGWRALPTVTADPLPAGEWSTSPGITIGHITRDHLVLLHLAGHHRDVASGLYTGLAAMLALFAILMTMAWRSSPPFRR